MIAFMLGVIAVIVNTLNGLDRVPRVLVKTARVLQMSPVETAVRVTLPFATPYMLTGIKFAVAYSLIGIIGSEFILSSNGIGFEISFSYNNYNNSVDVSVDPPRPDHRDRAEHPAVLLGEDHPVAARPGMSVWLRWRGAVILIASLLIVWQALYWFVGDIALRSPLQTFRFTSEFISSQRYWPDFYETFIACTLAVLIAASVGLATGLVLGFARIAGQVFEPMLVAIYSIPKLTLYPILLLVFGLGMSAKVAFGAIHGIIPIALFTINAVRNIRPVLIKTGRVLKYSPAQMAWKILDSGGAAGDRHWAPNRLLADARRHAARRDVRVTARPRQPADASHRAAQCRPDHGDRAGRDRRCSGRKQSPAGRRSPTSCEGLTARPRYADPSQIAAHPAT